MVNPYYQEEGVTIYCGDCLTVMPSLPENSVDSVITDPPYGLSFMGKDWDHGVPGTHSWQEALRVAKPGAMLMAFGGTRTHHRLMVAIEDAGWEIRDCLMWLYGSGFPKSLDISKAIDKEMGAEREVTGTRITNIGMQGNNFSNISESGEVKITAPSSDAAKVWSGYGTALKPAWEPIILAMKPIEGTFAQNAQKWGVAGINVDGGRIGTEDKLVAGGNLVHHSSDERTGKAAGMFQAGTDNTFEQNDKGRFPANLMLDDEAAEMLDEQIGELVSGSMKKPYEYTNTGNSMGKPSGKTKQIHETNSGGASRFFYVAKASKSDRGEDNSHPTVKPSKLMEYLCLLTKTPTGGVVLDPFMGSGSTVLAANKMGRSVIGIEIDEKYCEISVNRLRQGVFKL